MLPSWMIDEIERERAEREERERMERQRPALAVDEPQERPASDATPDATSDAARRPSVVVAIEF
jgi:hypothetical protein